MKKSILIFSVVVFNYLFLINDCFSQWVHVSGGISDVTIMSLVRTEVNLLAGSYLNGVYATVNNGTNWTQTSLNNKSVSSLIVSGSNVIAGTMDDGIYISENNGATWVQTSTLKDVRALTLCGNYIFAGTFGYGVYFSTNNGQSWSKLVNAPNSSVLCFAANNSVVYAGTELYGVYRSTNYGISWTPTSLINIIQSNIYCLALSGSTIYAATTRGLYYSTNDGANWTQTLNNQLVYTFAVSGSNIIANTQQSGFVLSSNNGLNWVQINEGIGFPTIISGAILITNNFIFATIYNQFVWRRPTSDVLGIRTMESDIPSCFSLEQNYPNPFNQVTMIRIGLPVESKVKLEVFNILGEKIASIINSELLAGYHEVEFNAENLSSGVYFYSISTNNLHFTKKMILMK